MSFRLLFAARMSFLIILAAFSASCTQSDALRANTDSNDDSLAGADWANTTYLCSEKDLASEKASSLGCYRGYSQAIYSHFHRESLYVPSYDGTKLAVDVYRPASSGQPLDGPLPTIFIFSRYWRATERADGTVSHYVGRVPTGQSINDIQEALTQSPDVDTQGVGLLIAHGYAFVRVEARGTGASFGVRNGDMSGTEIKDARHIIQWIRKQPWSTGRIGMIGQSYEGMSQYLVASGRPEGLVSIMPGVATFDEYRASWSGAGVLRKYGLAWLAREAQRDGVQEGVEGSSINPVVAPAEVARVDADMDGSLRAAARLERLVDPEATDPMLYFTRQSPEAAEFIKYLSQMLGSERPVDVMEALYSSQRLRDLMDANPELAAKIRSLHFYRDQSDMLLHPQDDGPNSLSNLAPRIFGSGIAVYNWGGWRDFASIDTLLWHQNLSNPKKLTMGPWTHGPNEIGMGDVRETASYHMRRIEQLRWSDYWVKGISNGIMEEPEIQYAEMGARDSFSWNTAQTLPLSNEHAEFFMAGNELKAELGRSAISQSTFKVDEYKTLGEHTRYHDAIGMGPLALLNLVTHAADGALSFTTAALDQPFVIAGSPIVKLYVSASQPDIVLNAYVQRVDRRGNLQLLADGVMHSRHRVLGKSSYDNLGLPFSDSRKSVVDATPGIDPERPTLMVFDLQPFAARFEKGEQIRLVITGAEAHTNLLIPPPQPAMITLHTAEDTRSALILPGRFIP